MANRTSPDFAALRGNCFDTALCLIPPKHLWARINNLRSHYDKAYRTWPPHINLVYPFVQVESLPRALEAVKSVLQSFDRFPIRLDAVGAFTHRRDNTIFLYDSNHEQCQKLKHLRQALLNVLGQEESTDYQPHMAIGQSEHMNESWHNFLLEKARLLPVVEFEADRLFVLVRKREKVGDASSSVMLPWAAANLKHDTAGAHATLESVCNRTYLDALEETEQPCFAHYETGKWALCQPTDAPLQTHDQVSTFSVATYNVLAEFQYPPSPKRYPLIIRNLLSDSAKADLVMLQEVTDDFLSFLLQRRDVRDAFRFCSHGPPSQGDIDPLPNHNNIVILSNHTFHWKTLQFNREHKAALIARFPTLGYKLADTWKPVVLAAVHLTHGLKNGAIVARKNEVERLSAQLHDEYADSPIILAGDFNLTTSSRTIKEAMEKNSVTEQSLIYHRGLEKTLVQNGFVDTWTAFQLEKGSMLENVLEPTFEGEQGATYDPIANALARDIVGSGSNMRPQRYDRILVKDNNFMVLHANQFGKITEHLEGEDENSEFAFASDHWGVRTTLRLHPAPGDRVQPTNSEVCHIQEMGGSMAREEQIVSALKDTGALPSPEEVRHRAGVFDLLKSVLAECSPPNAPIVIVPVGSYGLGVWTNSSDIDCLCIGSFSPKTFFALAAQKLRRNSDRGIKITRWVHAQSGTMIELDVLGTRIDLQYAAANAIAQNWNEVLKLPPTDPIWALSSQTLNKLKAIRDLDYITRSVPDITKFRLAHRFIKTWAKKRGVYTAKYGYLGGIQIAILLARVYKMSARQYAGLSIPDILATFFDHYAHFNWKEDLVFDPLFHKNINYRRTDREPLAILGYFPPALNTMLNASISTVRAISEEFRLTIELLSENSMTWSRILEEDGSSRFLRSFKSFIQIDVQFWGGSLTKGRGFVGWVESRCVSLLVDLQKRMPDLYPRIWPARWVEMFEDRGAREDDADNYQGFYLIGLDNLKKDMDSDEKKIMRGTLLSILGRFETQIRSDDRYFDEKTSWLSAGVVHAADLKPMEVDDQEWSEFAIGDDEIDDELDDGESEQLLASWGSSEAASQVTIPLHTKKGSNIRTNSPRSATVPKPQGAGKFRTASDVLHRLRWDSSLDSGDYIVGYEDRFVGAMERSLEAWKLEQTHEEFIPQHRILYFKRKSDGVIVWERRTRTDLLFGSGPSQG